MKAEKGSEIITTICEYENSVAMPDNERLTYLDTCGIARLKDGNGNVKAQEVYANRCSKYLRFGHEVDLAACGAYSPYDALKVCDTPEIFLKTGFEQRPMLYTQKHLFQALTPKSDYNPHRHGFSIEQVKRFPELLASPVVLANSPTMFCLPSFSRPMPTTPRSSRASSRTAQETTGSAKLRRIWS